MLYGEFIEGAKIPEDVVSWCIFNCLHKFYMQTDEISKEQVYARGETLYKGLRGVVVPFKVASVVLYGGGEVPHCGRCGLALAGNENYCPDCGARLLMDGPEKPVNVPEDFIANNRARIPDKEKERKEQEKQESAARGTKAGIET